MSAGLLILCAVKFGFQRRRPGGSRRLIHGALRVARHLLHYWGPGATLVTHPVAGHPALLGFTGRDCPGCWS